MKGAIGVVEMERIDDLDALRARFVEEGVFVRPFGNIIYLTPAFTIARRRTQDIDRRGGQSRTLDEFIGRNHGAYSGPVIDTHHHIWLRKDIPWLADPPIPRMYGEYFGLRRDYPVEEWINDIVPEGVTKSVHVTAMWGTKRALDETRWLQSVADKHGFPHGIVCQAEMTDPDLDAEAEGAEAVPQSARRAPAVALGQPSAAPAASRRRTLQHAGFPPRLRAAGEIRPAFRIAGLRRPGEIRRRADQGVSQCAA